MLSAIAPPRRVFLGIRMALWGFRDIQHGASQDAVRNSQSDIEITTAIVTSPEGLNALHRALVLPDHGVGDASG
jgi:hypothetical protein